MTIREFEGLEIETPHGFVPFDGITQMPEPQNLFEIVLDGDHTLTCTYTHKLFSNGDVIHLKDVEVGITEIDTKNGPKLVHDVKVLDEVEYVYDVHNVHNKDHSYYSNDIVSHNCSFHGSSVTLIEADYMLNKVNKVEPTETIEEHMKYWNRPVRGRKYAVTVDVSNGVGSDFSVANVWDTTDWAKTAKAEQVACYRRNDINVPDFTKVVYELGKEYNDAYLVIETNANLGAEMVRTLQEEPYEYENLFFNHERNEFGIYSTKSNKPVACAWFKELLEGGQILLKDEMLIKEIGYFEEVSPKVFKAKNTKGCHDDTVMTAIWFSHYLKSKFFADLVDMWEELGYEDEYALDEDGRTLEDRNDQEVWDAFLDADHDEHDNWLDKDINGNGTNSGAWW